MRVCFVCNEYPPSPHGGIGSFVYTLAHRLYSAGQQVYVIGYDSPLQTDKREIDLGVEVLRLSSPYQNTRTFDFGRYRFSSQMLLDRIYLSRRINQLIDQNKLDLVESYDWSGPLWSRPKVPLVIRLHGANSAHRYYEHQRMSWLLHFFERRNIQLSDSLIAVSNHIGHTTLKALNLEHKNFELIYNGVDCQLFNDYGIQRKPNEVLFVGSVTRRKGIFELFHAFKKVLQADHSVQLTIVGSLPQGDAKKKFISQLLEILPEGAHNNVNFVGRVSHHTLPEYYNRATLAVFPSLAEAFGLTCAEAMACATPVIMTSGASGPEIIEHGVSGLLVNVQDATIFSQAILSLMKNPELRNYLGNNARKKVLTDFNIEKLFYNNLEYYGRLVQDGN